MRVTVPSPLLAAQTAPSATATPEGLEPVSKLCWMLPSVAPLQHTECETLSTSNVTGWRVYRTDQPDLDEPPAVACYCPVCADRETCPLLPRWRWTLRDETDED